MIEVRRIDTWTFVQGDCSARITIEDKAAITLPDFGHLTQDQLFDLICVATAARACLLDEESRNAKSTQATA